MNQFDCDLHIPFLIWDEQFLCTSSDGGRKVIMAALEGLLTCMLWLPQITGHDTDKEKSPSVLTHRADSQLKYTHQNTIKVKRNGVINYVRTLINEETVDDMSNIIIPQNQEQLKIGHRWENVPRELKDLNPRRSARRTFSGHRMIQIAGALKWIEGY